MNVKTRRLILLRIGCWLCYFVVTFSTRSLPEAGSGNHALRVLLALFGVAFGLHLVALRVAIRLPDDRRLLAILWTGAIAFNCPCCCLIPSKKTTCIATCGTVPSALKA